MSQDLKIVVSADVKKATEGLKKLDGQVKNVANQMKSGAVANKKYSHSMTTLTKGLRSYISAYAAIAVGRKTINSLKDLETGFVGIRKTTNLSTVAFKGFKKDLVSLSKNLSGIDIRSLQEIATTAGQLGISGTKNILKFTEAIAKISVTTDLTAEQAAKGMAIFTNIMDIPITEVGRLGSVMNELSNTSNATSSQILDFSRRLAGAAKIANYSGSEVMALAATLADVGARVEGGGTAVSRVIIKMQEDVSGFAKVTGKSFNEFSATMTNKPVKALEQFIKALGRLNPQDKIKALKDLGLSSVETTSVMLRMAAASNKLSKNLATAKKEYKENTSLNKEFAFQSKTLAAELVNLDKAFQILLISLSKELLPALKEFVQDLASGADSVSEFYKENKILVKTLLDMIALIGGLYAFRRVLLAVVGTEMAGLLAASITGWAAFGTQLAKVTKLAKAFIMSPLGVVLMGAAVAFGALNYQVEKLQNRIDKLNGFTELQQGARKLIRIANNAMVASHKFIQFSALDTKTLIQDLKAQQEVMRKAVKDSIGSSDAEVRKHGQNLVQVIKDIDRTIGHIEDRKSIGTDYANIILTAESAIDKTTKTIALTNVQQEEYVKTIDKTIKANEEEITTLKKSFVNKDKNKIKIEELIKVNKEYAKIKKEVAGLKPIAYEDYAPLTAAHQKYADKVKKSAEQRLKVSKNTVVEIKNRETKLYQDLAKLDQELNQIRQKFANQRVSALDRIQDKLRNAENKGRSEIGKYNSNQLTADKKYAKAKDALVIGNIELAKRYLSEYYSLVDSYAGEEITTQKEIQVFDATTGKMKTESIKQVQLTRQQSLAEYRRDLQKGSDFEQQLISKVEAAEIAKHNEKIAMKQVELQAVKVELEAQQQMVKLYAKMIELSTGVKSEPYFSGFENSIKNINNLLKGLEDKKRTVKVDVQTNARQAKQELSTITGEYDEITVFITADPDEFDKVVKENADVSKYDTITLDIDGNADQYGAVLQKVDKQTRMLISSVQIDGDTKKVDAKIKKVEAPSKSVHTIIPNTSKIDQVLARIKKPTSSTHTIYVKKVTTKASGGLIEAFADGGHIRKIGKIGGHDLSGRDDVKALLTKGEFVQNVRAVDYYGAGFMEKLNNLQLPKFPAFASGGLVPSFSKPPIQRFSSGGAVQSSSRTVDINLNLGSKSFSVVSEESVATALADYLQRGEF